jgi:hypothetical protein
LPAPLLTMAPEFKLKPLPKLLNEATVQAMLETPDEPVPLPDDDELELELEDDRPELDELLELDEEPESLGLFPPQARSRVASARTPPNLVAR